MESAPTRDGIVHWKRVIGIAGGMGVLAHIEFERRLIGAAARRFGRPLADQDYPPWIVSSIPATPDRTENLLGGGPSPVPMLELSLRRLAGDPATLRADFAVIPCNTAHAFLGELRARVAIPILDMVAETAGEAVRRAGEGSAIGLLATTGTIAAGLYQRALADADPRATLITPLDLPDGDSLQETGVMTPIFGPRVEGARAGGGIKSGGLDRDGAEANLIEPLRAAVRRLGQAGATIVIAGCTEIPLALGRGFVDAIPTIDPLQVAAEAAIAIALGERDTERAESAFEQGDPMPGLEPAQGS